MLGTASDSAHPEVRVLQETDDNAGNPVTVKGLTGVTQVSAGTEHSLAPLSNGTVMAWGDNAPGELGDGTHTSSDVPVPVTGLTGVTTISGGGYHALALMSGGTMEAWGENLDGQLGDGGPEGSSNVPVKVTNMTSAVAISAGDISSLALLSDGTVDGWGDNGFFELAQPNGFPAASAAATSHSHAQQADRGER